MLPEPYLVVFTCPTPPPPPCLLCFPPQTEGGGSSCHQGSTPCLSSTHQCLPSLLPESCICLLVIFSLIQRGLVAPHICAWSQESGYICGWVGGREIPWLPWSNNYYLVIRQYKCTLYMYVDKVRILVIRSCISFLL